MQAVFRLHSSQYLVSPGDELLISSPPYPSGQVLTFDQVLLAIDGDQVLVGRPVLPDIRVTATVIDQVKGSKLRVSKYRAKSRYRKTIGFRPRFLKVKIDSISASKTAAPARSSRKIVKSKI